MTDLTIIVVNYNSGEYLKRCLSSIKKIENEARIKTIVVDNASTDDSLGEVQKSFKDIEFIKNEKNLGFGKANNLALKKAKSEYVLLLNPDTVLEKEVTSKMLKMMGDDPTIGAATCKIVLGNGKVDLTAHRGFPTPWVSFLYYVFKDDSLYHLKNRDMSKLHEVDAIAGAFFLTRKSVLEKVGLFDEDFFLYGEDIDLCYRIKEAGFKVVYEPSVFLVHHKGVSSGLKKHSQQITQADKETKLLAFNAFYESMKIFYKKHYQKKYPTFITFLIMLGINFKWWMAKRRMIV